MRISPYQRARILMFIASVFSVLLFLGFSRLMNFPIAYHQGGSFVIEGGLTVFISLAATFALSLLIGTLLLGRIRFDAGLVCACVGLGALSFVCGDIRSVIQSADMPEKSLFFRLAIETALLIFIIASARMALGLFKKTGSIRDSDEATPDPDSLPKNLQGNNLPAFAIQLLATFLALMFFIPSDEKLQALIGVAAASFIGVIVAQSFFETSNTALHWLVPLLLALFGYVAFAAHPLGAETANLTGTLAPLARPTPLDYAGAGPVGAIVGHWICRIWSRDLKEEEESEESTSRADRPPSVDHKPLD
jgi:hypothetical protein